MRLVYEKPTPMVVTITPEIAKEMLETSEINRTIYKHSKASYARDMKAGEYKLNGEAIIFSNTGRLVDGHHRLLSVLASGATIESVVVFGIPEENTGVIDVGKSRSIRDTFNLNRLDYIYTDSRNISITRIWFVENRNIDKSSPHEIQDFIERNYDAFKWIRSSFRKHNSTSWTSKAVIVYALFCAYICGEDSEKLISFGDSLDTGIGRAEGTGGCSVATIERDLKTHDIKGGSSARKHIHRCVELAIMDYCNGVDRRKTYWNKETSFGVYSSSDKVKAL